MSQSRRSARPGVARRCRPGRYRPRLSRPRQARSSLSRSRLPRRVRGPALLLAAWVVVTAWSPQEPLFDPDRDPAADLEAAIAEATETGRRIILDVGGSWCGWCLILDRFIEDRPELRRFVDDNYVWVRVNFGPENRNEEFLSQYPRIQGYPHLFVLDSDGTLLHSQDTAELEEGKSYDPEKMWAFLREWAPGAE